MTTAARVLVAVAALLALSACLPASADTPPPQTPQSSSESQWLPSEQWLMLHDWDASVRQLLQDSINEPDPDRKWELVEQYRQERDALQQYLLDNPDADAPCSTLYRWAPQEMWPSGPCLDD